MRGCMCRAETHWVLHALPHLHVRMLDCIHAVIRKRSHLHAHMLGCTRTVERKRVYGVLRAVLDHTLLHWNMWQCTAQER